MKLSRTSAGVVLLAFGLALSLQAQEKSVRDIYHKGWTDFNKNGVKDIYEDST